MLQDVRFALRLIAKERWFSAAAVAVLALGIGVNATGFTLVSGVFLRERSLRDANQLYVLSWAGPGVRRAMSFADFDDWRAQSQSFAYLAALVNDNPTISDDRGLPEQVFGARVTREVFGVFEQYPIAGRVFTDDDVREGAAAVAIISRRLWRERYSEDPGALGATLRINGTPTTIIGVMPDGIRFPGNAELWRAFIPSKAQLNRSDRPLLVFGRLKHDVSRRAAASEANAVAARVIAANPVETKGFDSVVLDTVPERFVSNSVRPLFFAMMAAVTFVLLIACANVANLLLSRSMYRLREVALRMMLGARRWRVVRQMLIETIVLAGVGGALGLLIAQAGVRLFDAAVGDPTRPYWIVFTVDWAISGYVALVCVLTAIAAGLAPALQASRHSAPEIVRQGARGTIGSARTRWFSGAMVVVQLALTLVLLTGAGLMARSLYNLQGAELGYDRTRVVVARLQLPSAKYGSADVRREFFDRLEPRFSAIAGIESVALTNAVPPFKNEERRIQIEGQPDSGQPPAAAFARIGTRFFDVLDRRVIRGRAFAPADALAGTEAVIINETFAQRFFPNVDPIGHRLRFVQRQPDGTVAPVPWRTVVGISPAIRYGTEGSLASEAVVYAPASFEPPTSAYVLLRTSLTPGSLFGEIRRAVQDIDRDQPVVTVQSIDALLRERQWQYTAFGGAFAIFAVVALALSSVGLYAVVAYSVSQRTQEIGVRLAVGARTPHVLWLLLRRTLVQAGLGLVIGLAGAFALSGVLQSLLVQITPRDPATFLGVSGVSIGVALAACLLPARRASRIDPLVALRQE
jgi:predicted permease